MVNRMLNYSASIQTRKPTFHIPLNPSIRYINCCQPLNLKPIFYGIDFFYDDEKKVHKCELKMESVIYTGISNNNKEDAYNQAKQKYLVTLKENINKPAKDYLTENKFENTRRFDKNHILGRKNKKHKNKSNSFDNEE